MHSFFKVTPIIWILATIYFTPNLSQSCVGKLEAECNLTPKCQWVNNQCRCGDTIPQDIMILMDASGSIEEDGWTKEQQFVIDVIIAASPLSRIGIIQFSTVATVQWNFEDNQNRSQIIDHVNNMKFTGGWTNTKEALFEAINVFDSQSDLMDEKLIILITDGFPLLPEGSPDPHPCRAINNTFFNETISKNIVTLIVGVKSFFDPFSLQYCVENSSEQIIQVEDLDDLVTIEEIVNEYTCLDTNSPTVQPSLFPTLSPSKQTFNPTENPTRLTLNPTVNPTVNPTISTLNPTKYPTLLTESPTSFPTTNPTNYPTKYPTVETLVPTGNPTENPTENTQNPTNFPSQIPTINPSNNPAKNPTLNPSLVPSVYPTLQPTLNPTFSPTTFCIGQQSFCNDKCIKQYSVKPSLLKSFEECIECCCKTNTKCIESYSKQSLEINDFIQRFNNCFEQSKGSKGSKHG